MARIIEEPGLFTVVDDDGGFTEFDNKEDAEAFMEDLE